MQIRLFVSGFGYFYSTRSTESRELIRILFKTCTAITRIMMILWQHEIFYWWISWKSILKVLIFCFEMFISIGHKLNSILSSGVFLSFLIKVSMHHLVWFSMFFVDLWIVKIKCYLSYLNPWLNSSFNSTQMKSRLLPDECQT